MIKTYDDHGRFLLVIEPVDDEAKILIKKIKQLCGIENQEDKSFKGLADIPAVPKPDFVPVNESEISPGLKAYCEACDRIKTGAYANPEEKAEMLGKVRAFAERLKTTVPSGKNLHYMIENMQRVFSQKTKDRVLNEMGMTEETLVRASEETLLEAYKKAVA